MKSLILVFSVILFANVSFSQSYSFSVNNGVYTDLSNPVSLNKGEIWEMADFIIPIGFDFRFFNSIIDTLYFFQDGSCSTLSSSNQDGGIHELLYPFGAVLVDRGYGTSVSQSPISYKLSGLPGSRILKIEWKNAGFYGELQFNGTTTDFISFQLWLHETTGNIEIHYGPSLINYPLFDYTGVNGPVVSIVPWYDWDQDIFSQNSLWLSGNPASPTMISSNIIYFLYGSIMPNTIYKFDNLTVNTPVISAIDAPVVYPNPVKDLLNIRLKTVLTSPATVIICDMTGRTVYNAAANTNQTGEIQIPVSDLISGIYQIVIKQGQETYTSRFVKLQN